jgi:hypothetical protein
MSFHPSPLGRQDRDLTDLTWLAQLQSMSVSLPALGAEPNAESSSRSGAPSLFSTSSDEEILASIEHTLRFDRPLRSCTMT